MARITIEMPDREDGKETINAMDITYDEDRSAWVVDLGERGAGGLSFIGTGIQQVVIPENRVYYVEFTGEETG